MIEVSLFHRVEDYLVLSLVEEAEELLETDDVEVAYRVKEQLSSLVFVVIFVVLDRWRTQEYVICQYTHMLY